MSESFVFYKSFLEAVEHIPDQETKLDVLMSICEYALLDKETDTENFITKSLMACIKPVLDSNKKKKEIGSHGGRPKEKTNGFENGETKKPVVIENEENKKPVVIEKNKNKKPMVIGKSENTKPNEEVEVEVEVDEDVDVEVEVEEEEGTDIKCQYKPQQIEKVVGLYNSTCLSLPKCRTVSEARRKAIKARFSSGYTFKQFEEVFKKAENSRFLKGANKNDWKADFDWLIKDANMAKVLDGKYDNKGGDSFGYDNDPQYFEPSTGFRH